ncbi:MAG TPA: hypothetical protein VF331_11390 [Polyangiales bacterium]
MKRSGLWVLFASLLWVGLSGRAAAEGSSIATSMGDLRWGMSEREVIAFVKRKLDERFAAQIKGTHDARRQSQLRDDMKRAQGEVQQSLTSFGKGRSSWDSSVIAGEFDHDNGESMVVYKDEASENYYFFLNGHLWKWYKALDDRAFGGNNYKRFSQSIEKKFGRGHDKNGELSPGQGQTQWIEYLDRNSRMRAADNTKHGMFALIFEDMATVRELASVRRTAPPSRGGYREDDSQPASTTRTEVAKAEKRRSVFQEDQHTETDAEYQARLRRIASDERQKQQNIHARKQEAKKGEALKPLEGIDDKDPLGGL